MINYTCHGWLLRLEGKWCPVQSTQKRQWLWFCLYVLPRPLFPVLMPRPPLSPVLQVLWLAENPLTSLPGYRARVLATLPHIRKLDNTGG